MSKNKNTPYPEKQRLGAHSLVFLIAQIIEEANNQELITDVELYPSHISFNMNEQHHQFHYPAQDTTEADLEHQLGGANPRGLPQLLNTLVEREVGPDNDSVTHLIPFAQTLRGHWTLLILKGTEATLIDPKNVVWSSWLGFGIFDGVSSMLTRSGYNLPNSNALYSGIQPDRDNTICGYVVATLMHLTLSGRTPQEIQNAPNEQIEAWTDFTKELPIPNIHQCAGLLNAKVLRNVKTGGIKKGGIDTIRNHLQYANAEEIRSPHNKLIHPQQPSPTPSSTDTASNDDTPLEWSSFSMSDSDDEEEKGLLVNYNNNPPLSTSLFMHNEGKKDDLDVAYYDASTSSHDPSPSSINEIPSNLLESSMIYKP